MSLNSTIYQSLIKFYNILPCKKGICQIIKTLNISNEKFYRDLRFKGKFKAKLGEKEFYLINYKSTIENEIFWKDFENAWEVDTFWIWEKLSKKSNTIFDIGANTGIFSLVSKLINPNVQIHAFEPVKRTYEMLSKNVSINNFDINSYQLAVSNITGKQTLYDVSENIQYSASLSPDMLKENQDKQEETIEYEIETITLDDFISKNNINNIDLMKVDVEMHEPEVLKGYTKINVHKPIIILEVLSDKVADQLNEMFIGSDFSIYHLEAKDKLTKEEKFSVIHCNYNFILCPKEKEYLLNN